MRLPRKTRSQWFALVLAAGAAGALFMSWRDAWARGGAVLACVALGTVSALVIGFWVLRRMEGN
jgi:hypothetical protein